MKKFFRRSYIGIVLFFLYAPIAVLILFSFNSAKSSVWQGFSFKWYGELFKNEALMQSCLNTLMVAIISSILATLLGIIASIGLNNTRKGWKKSLSLNVSNLPIINPEIVTGVSLMLLFVFFGNLFGFEMGMVTVILSHICFSVPYVILNIMPKLRNMDPNIFEAAQDLGCSRNTAFRKVVIPEIMPGILSGFLMAFTFSLDDFIITYFTSGSSFQTLPVQIYSILGRRYNPSINALSTILFLIVLVLLVLINIKDILDARKEKTKEEF